MTATALAALGSANFRECLLYKEHVSWLVLCREMFLQRTGKVSVLPEIVSSLVTSFQGLL